MGIRSALHGLFFPHHIRVAGPYGGEVSLDLSRLARNITDAQIWLTTQVAADCTNFVPFQNGTLRGSLTYPNGLDGGQLEWNTPYAHYLYEGEVYINPKYCASGFIGEDGLWHGWRGPKVPSGRPITYHTEGTGDHWFEKAKQEYGAEWIAGAKRIARRGL